MHRFFCIGNVHSFDSCLLAMANDIWSCMHACQNISGEGRIWVIPRWGRVPDQVRINLEYDISDVHVHIGQDSIIQKTVSASKLLNYLKSHNLKQILGFSSDLRYQHYNRVLDRLVKRHKEIYGLVKVALDYDQKETFGLLENPKFIGIKVHPSLDRAPVTHKRYIPLFRHLQEIKKVALIHCGRWQEIAGFRFAFDIAHTYPELRVILAHMGGLEYTYSKEAIQLAQHTDNVWLETSNCYLPVVIEDAVEKLGDKRIMFGSDYPWGTWLGNLGTIIESEIPEKSKKRILGKNFRSLLLDLNKTSNQ
jgi:predicted TIM-barrel fold metal-dependent hydrolase